RDSMGVRGILLADGDVVISMAVINHSEATAEQRAAYLKRSRAMRGEVEAEDTAADEAGVEAGELDQELYAKMGAQE
ncbi:hypothetical protein, partial [Escherichia coli]|uniref:hypothetical protein n=1 Tax=Escherichia coli TaxID=562 RepID=UPI00211A0226